MPKCRKPRPTYVGTQTSLVWRELCGLRTVANETMLITLAAYIITPVSYSTQSPFLRFFFLWRITTIVWAVLGFIVLTCNKELHHLQGENRSRHLISQASANDITTFLGGLSRRPFPITSPAFSRCI